MSMVPVYRPDADKLFAAVGEALSKWTVVELQLGLLFGVVSHLPDVKRANAIFNTIISFETRQDVLDRLMGLDVLDPIELEMWERLSRRLSKFYKKRHEIAHFRMLVKEEKNAPNTPHVAPFFTYERWVDGKVKTLSLDDVRLRQSKFEELAEAVQWFIQNACARARPEEYPLPEGREDPPLIYNIRALAAQILEERQKQSPPVQG